MKPLLLLLCSLLIQFNLYACFLEPVTTYAGYTVAAGLAVWGYNQRCKFVECCELIEPEKFEHNLRALLDRKLFAQPLLNQILPTAIHSHINKKYPSSPLVISLHGWTGSGKTYTSQMVAETLFPKGLKSIFVKKLTPAVMFPNPNQVDFYKVGDSVISFQVATTVAQYAQYTQYSQLTPSLSSAGEAYQHA